MWADTTTVGPCCHWPSRKSVRLRKCVTAFTWNPTASGGGVREVGAAHYDSAAGEWEDADGWLHATDCYLNGYTSFVCA